MSTSMNFSESMKVWTYKKSEMPKSADISERIWRIGGLPNKSNIYCGNLGSLTQNSGRLVGIPTDLYEREKSSK